MLIYIIYCTQLIVDIFERKNAICDYINVMHMLHNSFTNLLFMFKSYVNKEKKDDVIWIYINCSNS